MVWNFLEWLGLGLEWFCLEWSVLEWSVLEWLALEGLGLVLEWPAKTSHPNQLSPLPCGSGIRLCWGKLWSPAHFFIYVQRVSESD